MKIAMYSDQFFPELSGVTDSVITTGEALKAAGHEVRYVAPHYSKKNFTMVADDNPDSAFAKRMQIPIIRIPSLGVPGAPSSQARFVFPLLTTLSTMRRFRPDVIHVHQPFGVGIEALIVSRLLRVPLIGTNHTRIEQYVDAPKFIKPAAVWLMRRYYSWFYSRCAYVSTPYAGLIDDMREMKFTAPASALPNAVVLDAFTSAKDDATRAAAKEALGVSSPVVLYVGRLSPEKHIDTVIQALAKLKKSVLAATLLIAGSGESRTQLEALAKELGIAEHVRFLGFVDPAALPAVYRAADVFTIMSTGDTQSLTLMQAYACGLPAVVADAGGLSEYAPEDCGAKVPAGDVDALAARLTEILTDNEQAARMGAAARDYVVQFSPATIAERWIDAYRVASSSASASRSRAENLRRT